MRALKEFITKNLIYPKEALENRVEGSVEVAYEVDGLGKIRNVKIISGLGFGCDEEVIRLVNMLVFQKAVNKGKRTLTRKKLKVDFKLPKLKNEGTQKITYTLTKSQPQKKEPPKKGGYTITLTSNN